MAWVPLESNPDVMNKYLKNLGLPEEWSVCDVYGTDPDLLATVPRPVLAVMLLFPCNDKYQDHKQQQEKELLEKGQEISDKVFYVKQNISNACGTVALIHSVANNLDKITLNEGPLKTFVEESAGMDSTAKGQLLVKAETIANVHQEHAQEGQSTAPDASQPVNFHFVSFVHCDGGLYELDGSKSFPIRHGDTNPDTFLEDATAACSKYMARDPENVMFTIMALTATPN